MKIKESFTFDDVMLVPKYSTIKSRSEVNLSLSLPFVTLAHPIVPSNMKTIMSKDMAEEVIKSCGLAVLHRFCSISEQIILAEDLIGRYGNTHLAVSVGVKKDDELNIQKFLDINVNIFCIDVAHGDSEMCINMIKYIRLIAPKSFIIAGNVACGSGAERLWHAGADAVKCGIGGGSICLTRINTGNGIPQMTTLIDVYERKLQLKTRAEYKNRNMYIISDGGCKTSGDVVKACCFADLVMCGNLFAGVKQTPGHIIEKDGIDYKSYAGSSTHKKTHIEGVEALVRVKGSYQEVLNQILDGLSSGCSYQGARNLEELRDNPEFIKITTAGMRESLPHDVIL